MPETGLAIGRMLRAGLIEQVPPNPSHASILIAQAELHMSTSASAAATDPDAAFALLYDAARKSLTAVLIADGLRVKAKGGHVSVYDAVRAELTDEDRAAIRPFDRLRKRRHEVEYLTETVPPATTEEVMHALEQATDILNWARSRLL